MRTSSNYSCYYFFNVVKEGLVRMGNTACWAGLMHTNKYPYYSNIKKTADGDPQYMSYKSSIDYIYIDYFRTKINSLANTIRLVAIINEITPCKIITKDNKKYIKYKLINKGHYGSNLVLLNFLRMIWYKPGNFNMGQFYEDIKSRNEKEEDPLYFLMKIVKDNIVVTKNGYGFLNHSLITPDIVPKNSNLLFKHTGTSMNDFLWKKNFKT